MAIANNRWDHRYYILSLFSFGNEYVYFRDKRKLNPEQQAVLDKIVGCAGDILATGDMDIYQRTYEQLRLALAPKKVGSFYLNFHYYWFILYSYVFEHIPTEALKNPIGKINRSTKYFFLYRKLLPSLGTDFDIALIFVYNFDIWSNRICDFLQVEYYDISACK